MVSPIARLAVVGLLGSATVVGSDSPIRFREVAAEWGVDFRHHHGGSGARYMVETMVGGVVVFDFDSDGDQDLLFIDGGALPGYVGEPGKTRLYRNDSGSGFVDVTDRAGLTVRAYGSGATAGDLENDGDLDLLVTAYGTNELWRNEGDGSFRNITSQLPVNDDIWSASAAFADTDRDGDLDLYVASYVNARLENHRQCTDRGIVIYCPPGTYTGLADVFYRNQGDGSLVEDTAAAGLVPTEHMAGLGIVFADLDDDGWPDLYVANDSEPNFLFHNRGDGTFEEEAFLWGTAVSERGKVEAGMGVDVGDVDGDGALDIVVTNFEMETNALYRNTGAGLFIDSRYPLNVAESSLLYLAFGVAFADLDQDGDLDLVIANGHVRDNLELFRDDVRSEQRNQVLVNNGSGRFAEEPDVGLDVIRMSRGLACGDLDLDGDLDVVIGNIDDSPEIYENLGGSASGGWIQIDLEGRKSNRFGIGSRVVLTMGDRHLVREARTASSFLSQNALTLHFGAGAYDSVGPLEVRWASGTIQRFLEPPVRRRLTLYER